MLTQWVAAQSKDGVIPLNGGRQAVYMKAPHVSSAEQVTPDGLATIYSNLGTGDAAYNAIAGSGILGKGAGQTWPEWLACGFIPTRDHVVTKIKVGVTHVSGDNAVVMSLNKDNGGVPGKSLGKWKFTGLPAFGDCCTVQVGKSGAGIPVQKGKMYWLVLRTTNWDSDTWDVWNNNIFDYQGRFANNLGSGWINEGIQELGAFGIFGQ